MNITRNQWIAITILALGLISGATGQMTDIFGAGPAKSIASAASFMSSFVAGIQVILGGQGQQVKDVRNMEGVQHIEVNEKANPTLAALAVDPNEPKIAPSQAAAVRVEAIAEGRV